jgi:hypothetical protein
VDDVVPNPPPPLGADAEDLAEVAAAVFAVF